MSLSIYNKESPFSLSSLIVERNCVFIVINRSNERSHSY